MKLKQQLTIYLQEHEGFCASGDLQRFWWPKYVRHEKKGYHTPRSVVRRLEEMVNEGVITVEHRNNHSWYSSKEKAKPKSMITLVDQPDGSRIAIETFI